MNQTKEQKQAAFMKAAAENNSNFLLHKDLIEKKIQIQLPEFKASFEHFYKTGEATDYFLLALIDYAESYHEAKCKVIELPRLTKAKCEDKMCCNGQTVGFRCADCGSVV